MESSPMLYRRSFCLCLMSVGATLAALQAVGDEPPSAAAPDGPRYKLQYKFRPGEIVRTQVWHRANTETTISGSTQTSESTSGSVKVWRVSDVDVDGKITFDHSVESIDMR